MGEVTFVLGGTRSGKSRYALARAGALGGDNVTYVATARPGDPELDRRIAGHRRVRPPAWTTVEVGTDLAGAIAAIDERDVLLVDSLTLWVAWCIDQNVDVRDAWERTASRLSARTPPAIVVSDEVGLGVIPANQLARRFVDEIGMLHQRVAAHATSVVLLVAGIPLSLKGSA